MPYDVTMPNGEVLHVDDTNPLDPQITIVHSADPGAPPLDPKQPAKITDNTPNPQPSPSGGGVGPMPDYTQFLIWIGALVVLWFVLSALAEAGYGGYAKSVAALIAGGALIYMGPKAIENAQKLTQPKPGG